MRVDKSFDDFVEAHSARLLRVAYLFTLDRSLAEDMLQTALLRTARRWRSARVSPEAYVRTVLVNLSHDRRRLLNRRPRERLTALDPESIGSADRPTDRVDDRVVVARALAHLPIRQRQVIVLRFFEDLPVTDTAALLGCSEGTVKSYTSRALARLRELLDDQHAASPTTTVEDTHAYR